MCVSVSGYEPLEPKEREKKPRNSLAAIVADDASGVRPKRVKEGRKEGRAKKE